VTGEPESPENPAPPRWLDAREQLAWRRVIMMFPRLQRTLAHELQRTTGLSYADYSVLVPLSEAPEGRLRPFELSGVVEWEKSRLSHHLTRMEARGLIERQYCPSDNRGAFIALTPVGRAAIEAAAPIHVEQVRRWFISALTSDQLDEFSAIADAVLTNLQPYAQGETAGEPDDAACSEAAGADCSEADDAVCSEAAGAVTEEETRSTTSIINARRQASARPAT
jgi:DNA-binding MarR family transcriptional regulator